MTFLPVTTTSRLIPSQVEMSDPFSVDSLGSIAVTSDPTVWARQHLLAILMTFPGERVMRPRYGSGLASYVFGDSDPLRMQQLASLVKDSIINYEPSIRVQNVRIIPNTPSDGITQIGIDFTVLDSVMTHTFAFSISGNGVEI